MSILTREEFRSEVSSFGNAMESQGGNYFLRTRVSTDVEAAEVLAAYDAALARIAELEKENTAMAERLIAGSEPIFASNAQLRARIAREFLDAVDAEWFSDGTGSMDEIRDAVLARWEAAGKEGE